ncbi:hypothetical protein GLYMA_13G234300v4 [Glycine max]|uniref:Secreted protein n=2 Tax=Glycine subgen. Soja TaxID=1462606 RepID=A0A0R0GST8_SOYBN|nr:hypothetical protein JHK87_037042 [Glycine soja]KAG4971429.1 hypothetical protein JHK85_037850 [Glycine max]KAH1102990.1 hypothetical protein GYH30_037146 [Glycine max]KRH21342.1 hypothetical protein GLYMA_13G234300v4 [Glycine max]RZB82486.1 hypothetical protein D0Y65_031574 [Glycine soja]
MHRGATRNNSFCVWGVSLSLWGLCSTWLPHSLCSAATEVDFGHHRPCLLILPNPSCDHQSYFRPPRDCMFFGFEIVWMYCWYSILDTFHEVRRRRD